MTKLSFLCLFLLFNAGSALTKPHGHRDIVRGDRKPGFGVNNYQHFIKDANDVALAVSGGAKPIEKTGVTDSTKAKISFYMDLIWTVANLAFALVWLKPELFPANTFNKSFLDNGFCLNPTNAPLSNPTQKNCAVFDWTMAFVTLLIGLVCKLSFKDNAAVWGNAVAYPLAHGAAHFAMFMNWIKTTGEISKPIEVIALAAILSMGPIGAYTNMNLKQKPESEKLRLGIFVGIWALMVLIFVKVIKKAVFALLYINVSINLCLMGSRLVLFGYKDKVDIDQRMKIFGPLFFPMLAAISLVIVVMWIEPTMCSAWFSKAGGHVWFDVALILMGLTGFFNAILSPPGMKGGKAFFY
jgi:hypothetical protein